MNCEDHKPFNCSEAEMMTEVPHEGLTDENADQFLADLKADEPKLINGPADRAPIERDSFLDRRVAVFVVRMPKGLSHREATTFKREVADSLEVIIRDAQMHIDSARTQEDMFSGLDVQ